MVTSDIGSDSVVWPIPDTDPFTLIPWLIPDVSRTPVNHKHRSSIWSPADSWTAGFKPWTANDCDISISYTPITTTRQFKVFPPLPPPTLTLSLSPVCHQLPLSAMLYSWWKKSCLLTTNINVFVFSFFITDVAKERREREQKGWRGAVGGGAVGSWRHVHSLAPLALLFKWGLNDL